MGHGGFLIPQKEADLEQLRQPGAAEGISALPGHKGKLKVVRTEALRAGFKECWQKQDYTTIVQMASGCPKL